VAAEEKRQYPKQVKQEHDHRAEIVARSEPTDQPLARRPGFGEGQGLCPRLHESAGKRLSTRTRPGAPWLKTTLVQAAWAAVRAKQTYLRAQFLRLKSRRGPKKAILAVAASMLTASYHILKNGVDYRDLGADHFDRRDKTKLARRLIRRLHDLGLSVEIRPAA
jgi:transposase